MTNLEQKYKDIAKKIKLYESGPAVDSMGRLGLKYSKNHGVSIIFLREIAIAYKDDSVLAAHLRESNIREMRILAEMIEKPETLTVELAEYIVSKTETAELAEQVCMNLFDKMPFAFEKAEEWIKSENEITATVGFILFSRLALKYKNVSEEKFTVFFPVGVKKSISTNIHLRKAISRAFRQTGFISDSLKNMVIFEVEKIRDLNNLNAMIVVEEVIPLLS